MPQDLHHTITRNPIPFGRRLAGGILKLMGWRTGRPDIPEQKFIVIVAPHTSNWDLVVGILCAMDMGLLDNWHYGFMVKHTALRWPVFGPFIKWLGGIGINRTGKQNAIDQVAAAFAAHDQLMIIITPEGTRKRVDYWKSGFYHIARKAGVPIYPGVIDYRRKVGELTNPLYPTGDLAADLEVLRAFYAGATALVPASYNPDIRLKELDNGPTSA